MPDFNPVDPFGAANDALNGKSQADNKRHDSALLLLNTFLSKQNISLETRFEELKPFVFMAIDVADTLSDQLEKRKGK